MNGGVKQVVSFSIRHQGTVVPNEREHNAPGYVQMMAPTSGLEGLQVQSVAMNRKRTIERFLKQRKKHGLASSGDIRHHDSQHMWHGNELAEIFRIRPSTPSLNSAAMPPVMGQNPHSEIIMVPIPSRSPSPESIVYPIQAEVSNRQMAHQCK
jgi:hypothetical protein